MKRAAASILLLLAAPALAHEGESHGPGWTFDAGVTVPLALVAIVYLVGLARLLARAGAGRSRLRHGAALFGLGWLILAGALISPLHEAGERSFTMHMIEHELIMLAAALLIVAGRPGPALLWGLPAPLRRLSAAAARLPMWRWLAAPVTATALQAIAIWAWHLPALFDLALRSEGWHIAQHLSFIVTAIIFWWAMANGPGGRSGYGLSALCLFLTSLIGGALGALMSLSASPWYRAYAALGMTPEGLSPVEDQQLAGLIMWIPGGAVHAAAAAYFLLKLLQASEARHAVTAE
jgi:cytochrome c oxidase assembly factor CtaG